MGGAVGDEEGASMPHADTLPAQTGRALVLQQAEEDDDSAESQRDEIRDEEGEKGLR